MVLIRRLIRGKTSVFILQVEVNEEVDSYKTGVIIDLIFILKAPTAKITERDLLF
jgi:hypothetical protein